MAGLFVKKGDTVLVISGKDRGFKGKVILALPDSDRLLVEGVNRVKRHTKMVNQGGRAGMSGGIVTQEAPISVSNVMLVVEVDGKKVPTRIGAKRVNVTKTRPDGTTYTAQRSVRIATRTGKEI